MHSVRALLEAGASVNLREKARCSDCSFGIYRTSGKHSPIPIVQKPRAMGCSDSISETTVTCLQAGKTPLFLAVASNHPECVRALLEKRADTTAPSNVRGKGRKLSLLRLPHA